MSTAAAADRPRNSRLGLRKIGLWSYEKLAAQEFPVMRLKPSAQSRLFAASETAIRGGVYGAQIVLSAISNEPVKPPGFDEPATRWRRAFVQTCRQKQGGGGHGKPFAVAARHSASETGAEPVVKGSADEV